ncbi:TRAP transporter substrate-binding protein [Candidatus Aerophobetes bacterium]|nr:TRAP transporter substrate-binding protein [Candidatus Aerophobetes bacterium]
MKTLKRRWVNIMKGMWIVVIFVLMLVGGVYAKDNPIVIGITEPDPISHINLESTDGNYGSAYNGTLVFKKMVERESGGKMRVKIYPNCQLGGEHAQMEAVRLGTVQAGFISTCPFPLYTPEWMAFSIPYFIHSMPVMYKVLKGQVGKEFEDILLEKTGIRILGWSQLGLRNFTNSVRPIHNPKDLKGMKIRVPKSADLVKLVEALGAQAAPISYSELYTALQQGVVDGEEQTLNIFMAAKLNEVQKYVTLDRHKIEMNPFIINEKFYRSLSPENRRIVKDAAITACTSYRGLIEFGYHLWFKQLEKEGIEIYHPTEQELEQFRKAAKPVEGYIRSKAGDEWVDKVKNAVEEAKKSLYELD